MVRKRQLAGLTLALALVGGLPALGNKGSEFFDCLGGSADCPEVLIEGDPFFEIPGFGPSPFRGYGDPSVRKDPNGDRLWMTYSYLSLLAGTGTPPPTETAVSIHLASSDDGGASWQFRRRLWEAQLESDPAPPGGAGISVHEVSTLARVEGGSKPRWYGLYLRYFEPFGPEPRRPGSFHFVLGRAKRPKKVAKGRQAILSGPRIAPEWQADLDLSSLDSELGECAFWTEPSLFGDGDHLYLAAQCLVIDASTGGRRKNREFLGLFRAKGDRVDRLEWEWRGKLSTRKDARRLGGDVLTQPELTRARDGSLLLLVTPKILGGEVEHQGCRVLELDSLDPPRLRRRGSGRPFVRADIRSSDSNGLGPGLCSYDPALATGVLFVRTEVDLEAPDIVFRLHSTGIHP